MTARRNPRGKVEDRWTKADATPSASHGTGKRWRARYVDTNGRENEQRFDRKADANRWLDQQTAAVVDGRHVSPLDAKTTVSEWCDTWLKGYAGNRASTVTSARYHIRHIVDEFGDQPLSALRPSQVKAWVAKMQAEGLEASTTHLLHGKLSQILGDAVHDGLLGRNPCSRRTSPPAGKPKTYCATTEQVWALYDAMPDHLQVAILLAAFVGLRIGEVCGLRVSDVDFFRGIVHPKQQWSRYTGPGAPLKTPASDAPIPIPSDLALLLAASVQKYGTELMVTNGRGKLCRVGAIQKAFATAREGIDGLPEGFSFHDLRHYFASALIASGADIKTVQARVRHADASTTLDTYGHLWPDADESTRAAIGAVIAERFAANPADRPQKLAVVDGTNR